MTGVQTCALPISAILTGETDEESLRQALREYRTQVHALKSNTAMIGALILSKLAGLLEAAAAEENIERIRRLHPVLLEEIGRHKEYMRVLKQESFGEKEQYEPNPPETEGKEEAGIASGTENAGNGGNTDETEDEEGELWI